MTKLILTKTNMALITMGVLSTFTENSYAMRRGANISTLDELNSRTSVRSPKNSIEHTETNEIKYENNKGRKVDTNIKVGVLPLPIGPLVQGEIGFGYDGGNNEKIEIRTTKTTKTYEEMLENNQPSPFTPPNQNKKSNKDSSYEPFKGTGNKSGGTSQTSRLIDRKDTTSKTSKAFPISKDMSNEEDYEFQTAVELSLKEQQGKIVSQVVSHEFQISLEEQEAIAKSLKEQKEREDLQTALERSLNYSSSEKEEDFGLHQRKKQTKK